MKAYEAALASSINAARLAKEKEIDRKKKRVSEKKSRNTAKIKFLQEFAEDCRDRIRSAVGDGEKSTKILLSQNNQDYAAGEHVYAEGLYQDYLKNAKFGKEVKVVMAKLRREGYKVEVESRSTEHDDSAAYMNSGGECGSETPWWTSDTVLVISWGKK